MLETEKCGKCLSDLFINHNDEKWCPKCNDIDYLNKSDSSDLCKHLIDNKNGYINQVCKKYSFSDLINTGCELREIEIKNNKDGLYISFEIQQIIYSTLMIRRALEGHHGEKNNPEMGEPETLAILFSLFRDLVTFENQKVLIENEYGNYIRYVNSMDSIFHSRPYFYKFNGENYLFIYNSSWLKIQKNLEQKFSKISSRKTFLIFYVLKKLRY